MITCSIKGCHGIISEFLGEESQLKRWIRLRACRCGAYGSTMEAPRSCTCASDDLVPTSYWPNLDWWAFGGVDEVVLCPRHRIEVFEEIIRQRGYDPSMNQEQFNRSNRH